jgi:hypothetical protein
MSLDLVLQDELAQQLDEFALFNVEKLDQGFKTEGCITFCSSAQVGNQS